METDRKTFLCRYASAGTEYTCRIDARSVEEAVAIMKNLPWGVDSGPIGLPRRQYPHLDSVINYAVSCLEQIRQRMARVDTPAPRPWADVGQAVNGGRS